MCHVHVFITANIKDDVDLFLANNSEALTLSSELQFRTRVPMLNEPAPQLIS
jgi:hypothetical protein